MRITSPLARIHRCGAALGLEQGVRAVGRDGPRSIPINGAGGGLWLSLGRFRRDSMQGKTIADRPVRLCGSVG